MNLLSLLKLVLPLILVASVSSAQGPQEAMTNHCRLLAQFYQSKIPLITSQAEVLDVALTEGTQLVALGENHFSHGPSDLQNVLRLIDERMVTRTRKCLFLEMGFGVEAGSAEQIYEGDPAEHPFILAMKVAASRPGLRASEEGIVAYTNLLTEARARGYKLIGVDNIDPNLSRADIPDDLRAMLQFMVVDRNAFAVNSIAAHLNNGNCDMGVALMGEAHLASVSGTDPGVVRTLRTQHQIDVVSIILQNRTLKNGWADLIPEFGPWEIFSFNPPYCTNLPDNLGEFFLPGSAIPNSQMIQVPRTVDSQFGAPPNSWTDFNYTFFLE